MPESQINHTDGFGSVVHFIQRCYDHKWGFHRLYITGVAGVFEPVPEEIGTNMEMIDKPPIELIKTAMIAYDYANQRIIFMLKDMDTSFVLSLPENRWNTAVFGRVKSVVNIFPYSYVHIEDRIVRLTDIYDYSSEVINKGIVVTRALKLDTLQLKRLMDMSVQGIFSGKQKMILFASQDGKKWYKIGKRRPDVWER